MPEYNYPDPSDPQFNKKVVDLLRQLFEGTENDVKTFNPISNPDVSNHGQMWFDGTNLKMNINGVIKTFTVT